MYSGTLSECTVILPTFKNMAVADTNIKPKILIGKAGLDGHDRGVKIVARTLQEAGFEVIYTGVHLTPEMIVERAIAENVDAIGISILSGAHLHVFEELFEFISKNNIEHIPVFGGGIVPKEDIEKLKAMGVREIFQPGTPLEEIIQWVNDNVTP